MSENKSAGDFDLEKFLPFRLHLAAETVSQSFRRVYHDEFGMTRSEWRVLAHMGQYGALTATDIGKLARLHKTKVSRAVFALEKRRWLSRIPDKRDRRTQILNLTKTGAQAYRQLGLRAQVYNDHLAKRLGEDKVEQILELACDLQKTGESR